METESQKGTELGVRRALLAPQPNSGSGSTVPHVPWSPSRNNGGSRWMWQTEEGDGGGGGMQHGHGPGPRPVGRKANTLTRVPSPERLRQALPGPRGLRAPKARGQVAAVLRGLVTV